MVLLWRRKRWAVVAPLVLLAAAFCVSPQTAVAATDGQQQLADAEVADAVKEGASEAQAEAEDVPLKQSKDRADERQKRKLPLPLPALLGVGLALAAALAASGYFVMNKGQPRRRLFPHTTEGFARPEDLPRLTVERIMQHSRLISFVVDAESYFSVQPQYDDDFRTYIELLSSDDREAEEAHFMKQLTDKMLTKPPTEEGEISTITISTRHGWKLKLLLLHKLLPLRESEEEERPPIGFYESELKMFQT